MIKITAAYPAKDGERILEFGPFDYVQWTYDMIRVGLGGKDDDAFGWYEDGLWMVNERYVTDGGPNSFSDLTAVPA